MSELSNLIDILSSQSSVDDAIVEWPVNLRKDLVLRLLASLPRQDALDINARLTSILHKDILTNLPPELAIAVFSNLYLHDILQCGLVSRYWGSLVNNQALWIELCNRHHPPMFPAETTWSDINHHRKGLASHGNREEQPGYSGDSEGDEVYDLAATMGSGNVDDRRTSVRAEVWERSRRTTLSSRIAGRWPSGSSPKVPEINTPDPPILSYRPLPTSNPETNYKHLYITHAILQKRYHTPRPPHANPHHYQTNRHPRQHVISPVSSVKSGGLPGHTENIYALSLIRHRMSVTLARPDSVGGGYDSLISLSSFARGEGEYGGHEMDNNQIAPSPVVGGRDWILSGSRDRTLRLWILDGAETRVVKVFHGGHLGSVLSHFTTKIAVKDCSLVSSTSSNTVNPTKKIRPPKDRLVAVSGGSDGTLCLWDIEHGEGKAEKVVKAHDDSILCVKGDDKHAVSSSKDRTIKVFDIQDLTCLRTIRHSERESRPPTAINSLSVSDKFIISGAGDKLIRIHCLHTGDLLAEMEGHSRGIASIIFEPFSPTLPSSSYAPRRPEDALEGTIITGSLDCKIRMWNLISYPSTSPSPITQRTGQVSFREMMDNESISEDTHMQVDVVREGDSEVEGEVEQSRKYNIERIRTCRADCDCPPLLARVNRSPGGSSRCDRCGNKGHKDLVRGLASNRSVFVSGSYDSSLRVWDRETGKCIQELTSGHSSRVLTVVADRMRVVSAGLDSKLIIWDYADGLDTSFIEP